MKKYLIKVNGNQYEVEVEEVKTAESAQPAKAAAPATAPKAAPVAAPKAQPAVSSDNAAQGSTVIKAPMPGTILKVNVNAGDTVKKGQVLLILEAMKMENELTAPTDGKVATVNVAKGSAVNVGDVLVSLE